MPQFRATGISVSATTRTWYTMAASAIPYWVKNVGEATVYLGPVDPAAPTPVDVTDGYPLEPGEAIQMISDTGVGPEVLGFNTKSGNSEVRILGVF